jgi:hypothetical protein
MDHSPGYHRTHPPIPMDNQIARQPLEGSAANRMSQYPYWIHPGQFFISQSKKRGTFYRLRQVINMIVLTHRLSKGGSQQFTHYNNRQGGTAYERLGSINQDSGILGQPWRRPAEFGVTRPVFHGTSSPANWNNQNSRISLKQYI